MKIDYNEERNDCESLNFSKLKYYISLVKDINEENNIYNTLIMD